MERKAKDNVTRNMSPGADFANKLTVKRLKEVFSLTHKQVFTCEDMPLVFLPSSRLWRLLDNTMHSR